EARGSRVAERLLVRVAPPPVLTRLERGNERVRGGAVVRTGVPVRGAVAAPHVAARTTHPQVYPPRTDREAVLATVGRRLRVGDLIDVLTGWSHGPALASP